MASHQTWTAGPPTTGHVLDRGPVLFAVTTATLIVATVFVAARLVCRVGIVRNVTVGDCIIVGAWILTFSLSFTIDIGTRHGLGLHDADIADRDWPTLRKCEYVFFVLYNPALLFFCGEGPLWPLVFALGLRGQGERTKRAAAWPTMGASGPLFWPFVQWGYQAKRRVRPTIMPAETRGG